MGKSFDANACKTNLKLSLTRIKIQKGKRENNIENTKRDIANLLRNGKDEDARIKAENIIRDRNQMEVLELLSLYCDLVMSKLGVIQVSKQCPPDIREAVCAIIFASPRMELKELELVRKLLIGKFGKEFALKAMSNKEGWVNPKVVEKLSIQTPENYLVYEQLDEIAKHFGIEWEAPMMERSISSPKLETSFPSAPSSHPSSSPQTDLDFPSPPSSTKKGGDILDFPSVPGSSASKPAQALDFPSAPTSKGYSINDFPSPPSSNQAPPPSDDIPIPDFDMNNLPGMGGGNIQFPSPPQPKSNPAPPKTTIEPELDFPSPPSSTVHTSQKVQQKNEQVEEEEDGVPDFDELTARFEKLKKNNLDV